MNEKTVIEKIGILDPEGINVNPLTGLEYSEEYKKLAQFWSKLPVYKQSQDIIKKIRDNQVLLCISSTGSGKSVIMPKLVSHVFGYKENIAMTLPKQIITQSAAEFSAKTLDVKLGEEVGYQYKGAPSSSRSDKTKILYATDGTIIARIMNDSKLSDFSAILIDEAHERSTNIDFLIYLLRETLKMRPEFKLIIMSATINPDIFRSYFSEFKYDEIQIEGERLYPIESIFSKLPMTYTQALEEGFNILIKVLKENDGDIIFFVTGQNDAIAICKKLNLYLENEKNGKCDITCDGSVFCVEVYAGMPDEQKELAQHKDKFKDISNKDGSNKDKYYRKVVLATNVAESSLTIDGIKYVIDTGFELKGTYDPFYRARRLDRELITQASAKQRMGRGGRTGPGVCYHLYTEDDFKNVMKKFQEPDIRISDISGECLSLLCNEKIGNVENLIDAFTHFIEPPKEMYVSSGISQLVQMGAVINNQPSVFGKLLNEIPVPSLFLGASLIYAIIYECSHEMLKIIAMIEACKMNISDIFHIPVLSKDGTNNQNNDKFIKARENLRHKYGDHLSLLNVFEKYAELKTGADSDDKNKKRKDWAYKNFIKLSTVEKARDIHKKYKMRMGQIYSQQITSKMLSIRHYEEILKISPEHRVIACLCLGHKINEAFKLKDDSYKTNFSKDLKVKINRMSFVGLKKNSMPSLVLYEELFISMGKIELNIVCKIPKIVREIFQKNEN